MILKPFFPTLQSTISVRHRFLCQKFIQKFFSMEHTQMENLKADVQEKFRVASETFPEAEESERDALQLFAFICELAFDVYLKKQMIERLTDEIRSENPPHKK